MDHRFAWLLLAPLACGTRPSTPAATASPPPPAPTAAPDLSPLPVPEGVAMLVRVSRPAADVATIAQLIPSTNAAVRALLRGPGPMVQGLIGERHAAGVDLEAPLDLLTGGERGAKLVLSLPIRADASPSAAEPVTPSAKQPPLVCIRMRAREPAWRLVCAGDEASAELYGPYLTRTVAGVSVESALRVTLFGSGWRPKLGERPVGAMKPHERQGHEAAGELFADLDTITVDLTLGTGFLETELGFRFKQLRSPLSLAITSRVADASPLPAAFWKLPRDSTLAVAGRGPPPGGYGAAGAALISKFTMAELEGSAAVTAAQVERITAATQRLVLDGGPFVFAFGSRPVAALARMTTAEGAPPAAPAEVDAALRRWSLVRTEVPVDRVAAAVVELKEAYAAARPPPPPAPPGARARPAGPGPQPPSAKPSGGERSTSRWSLPRVTPADRLPPGSFRALQANGPLPGSTSPRRDAAAGDPSGTHYVFVPDGVATWISISDDATVALDLARGIVDPTPTGTLAARDDLAPLRGATGHTAGFVTLEGIVTWMLRLKEPDTLPLARVQLSELRASPDQGSSPVFISGQSRAVGEGGHEARYRARLSPVAVSSLFAWALLPGEPAP